MDNIDLFVTCAMLLLVAAAWGHCMGYQAGYIEGRKSFLEQLAARQADEGN